MVAPEGANAEAKAGDGRVSAEAQARASDRLARFEYDVFLSYSSKDRARAAAVVERLRAEGLRVFWDRDIVSGALWRPALTKAIRVSQCTLVMWSAAAQRSSWVQAEAEKALALGVFQQLLLEPVEVEMPFNQHQVMADLSTWRPGERHEALELLAARLRELVKEPVSDLEKFLVKAGLRRIRRRRQWRAALRVAAPIALIGSFLLAAGVLDRALGVDTRLRLISVWARGALTEHALHTRVTFVRIDAGTFRALGKEKYDKSWRGDLASAIRNLARHRAAVVALDITIQPVEAGSEASAELVEQTRQLAKAIREARSWDAAAEGRDGGSGREGTAVVVGVTAWDAKASAPLIEPEVRAAMSRHAGRAPGYLGALCGGTEGGFASTFPVLIDKREAANGDDARLVKSLSLATSLAFWGTRRIAWSRSEDRIVKNDDPNSIVRLSGTQTASESPEDCSIIEEKDELAELIVEQAPAADPWRRVVPFEKAVRGELDGFEARIRDQICLVGVDAKGVDRQRVWSGGITDVAGVKLHADAVTTILNGTALQRLPPFLQLGLMLVLGALGAWCRAGVSPRRRNVRAALLASLVAVDVVLAVVSAAYFDLFMDASYHVLAIVLTYWYAGRLEGRFFTGAPLRAQGEAA